MNASYRDACITLTTKHLKSAAVAPPFERVLACRVVEYMADTDRLGTFSGEVERQGNALECVKRKCEWGLEQTQAEFGLASEGSFGPHPFLPFLPSDHEILYFIDCRHQFHLHLSHLSENTNYQMKELDSLEALQEFAGQARFPSHALIVRPNRWEDKSILFKGIANADALEAAFTESILHSADGKVWVETDMRAQYNPSRMAVIGELAEILASRLATHCPRCNTPGWGKVRAERGLPCSWCGTATELVKSEVFGCTKCKHEETTGRPDGLTRAEPVNCPYCNP